MESQKAMTEATPTDQNVLSGLCEVISDVAVVLNTEGTFVDTIHNAYNGALFYESPEELLGEDLWDIFPESQADRFYAVVETALTTGEKQHIEYRLPLNEGDRYFEARVSPVDVGETDSVLWLAEDITQRRRRQEKQELLERVFAVSPVGIVVVDSSGTISMANGRAEDLLGLEHNEITSQTYNNPRWNIFYEDGTPIPEDEHPVTKVLETGEHVFGFEHWIKLPDGTERWLSSNSAPILNDDGSVERVVVGIDDATRLKNREEQLEWLVGTEVLADVGGWELNLETERMEGTAGMQRLHGSEQYDLSLEEALTLYHPEDREKLRSAIDACHRKDDPFELEARRQATDGNERWFRIRGEKVVQDGTPKIRGIVRDITRDKEREQRLMVMSRILRHNIRNKLTVIRGNATLLRTDLDALDAPTPAERGDGASSTEGTHGAPTRLEQEGEHLSVETAKESIARIEDASTELASLAERARAFDQIVDRDLLRGTVHLRTVLEEICDEFADQHPEATINVCGPDTEVSGDRMAVHLIFEILVENALEYAHRSDPTIALEIEETGKGQVTVSVDDDGPGIPEMERSVLTSEKEGPVAHSHGLGLWTVKWLTRRLGGSATLDESGDSGTCVELTFPLVRDD